MISLKYDGDNDILYLAFSDKSRSYGDEQQEGFVLMKDLFSGEITGVTIMDFLHRYNRNELSAFQLPVAIDYKKDVIPYI